MHEVFVSFNIAKRLKWLGFNWPCADYWVNDNDSNNGHEHWVVDRMTDDGTPSTNEEDVVLSRPTICTTAKWLREVKGIHICIWNNACGYGWELSKAGANGTGISVYDDKGDDKDSGMWTTFDGCLTAAILHAINLLERRGGCL